MALSAPTNFATGSAADASSCSTESKTPSANGVYIVHVDNGDVSGADQVQSISGWGITWNQIQTVATGSQGRITSYWGRSASPTTGVLTVTFALVQDKGITIRVEEWLGADLTEPVGTNKDTSYSTTNVTTISGTLSTIAAGNGLSVAVHINGTLGSYTPGADLVSLGEWWTDAHHAWHGYALANQTAPSLSWTNARYCCLSCFEIKAATGGGEPPPAGTSTNSNTVASASFTAEAGAAYIVLVAAVDGATISSPTLSGISGLSGSYTSIGSIGADSDLVRIWAYYGTGLTGTGAVTATLPQTCDAATCYVYEVTGQHATDFIGNSVFDNSNSIGAVTSVEGWNTPEGGTLRTLAMMAIHGAVTNFAWSPTQSIVGDWLVAPATGLTVAVGACDGAEADIDASWTTARYVAWCSIEVLAAAAGGGGGGAPFLMLRRK